MLMRVRKSSKTDHIFQIKITIQNSELRIGRVNQYEKYGYDKELSAWDKSSA